jgi:hypothetical protein
MLTFYVAQSFSLSDALPEEAVSGEGAGLGNSCPPGGSIKKSPAASAISLTSCFSWVKTNPRFVIAASAICTQLKQGVNDRQHRPGSTVLKSGEKSKAALCAAAYTGLSRRDCVLQPRVARNELPWGNPSQYVPTAKRLRRVSVKCPNAVERVFVPGGNVDNSPAVDCRVRPSKNVRVPTGRLKELPPSTPPPCGASFNSGVPTGREVTRGSCYPALKRPGHTQNALREQTFAPLRLCVNFSDSSSKSPARPVLRDK